jgi:hypothetical protein
MTRRFVILKHDHPFLHWDLLLEEQSSARTWRLLRRPCMNEPIAAQALPPHRLEYLTYEGPVSNGRGHVERMAAGAYSIISSDERRIQIGLTQTKLAGGIIIESVPDGRIFVTLQPLQDAHP